MKRGRGWRQEHAVPLFESADSGQGTNAERKSDMYAPRLALAGTLRRNSAQLRRNPHFRNHFVEQSLGSSGSALKLPG